MTANSAPTLEAIEESNTAYPIGRRLRVAIGLSALMFYRTTVAFQISEIGEGTPDFWIVAISGDVFMGLTAPIVAVLLWKKRGMAIWITAIVWHAIGIKDYLAGSQFLGVALPGYATVGMLAPIFVVGITFHLICIFLLSRYRRRYLG